MGRRKEKATDNAEIFYEHPALTPEGRENQLISYAQNLAAKQLQDGTASAQVICLYLKLGCQKEQVEIEKMRKETALLEAKVKAIERDATTEKLFTDAINAMRSYSPTKE